MSMPDPFEIRHLENDISLISERGVRPWLRCNIWHVRGRDRDLVIDTGMGLSPLKARIAADTDRPLHAIITHAHFDHSAGLHEFDYRLAHPIEAEVMSNPDWHNTLYGGTWSAIELIDPNVYPEFDPTVYRVKAAPLTGHLEEGDIVDLGDRVFRVLHLPGHSPGSIGLFEEATGTLFSGDAVYDGEFLDNLFHSDPAVLRHSLERLRKLGPSTIHGGHYRSFGQRRLEELIDLYAAGKHRIEDFDAWMKEKARLHRKCSPSPSGSRSQ
jgi:glyoxylase-like metal-dependent hydrolase (beta-lactamase superfamily II)